MPLAWLGCFDWIGRFTWGHGRQTFFWMVAALALVLALLFRKSPRPLCSSGRLGACVMVVFALALLAAQAVHLAPVLRAELRLPDGGRALDMTINTTMAGDHALHARNPYAHFCLVQHEVKPLPGNHITRDADGLKMFGVPYRFGYPYFPLMFLSYLPFRGLAESHHAVRLGSVCFALLSSVLLVLLVRRLVPVGSRTVSAAWALALFWGVRVLDRELVVYAIPDFVIGTYALLGFLCLSHGRFALAGVFLGMAQSCKLLPGPLLLLPVLLTLGGAAEKRRLLVAYAATALAFVAPCAAAEPRLFLSSTVLYYLTHHVRGDDTSMWFFLPAWFQPVFLFFGYGAALSIAALGVRPRLRHDVRVALALSFCSYFVFVAFGKMTHLNYIWSIYPLGCLALVTLLFGEAPGSSRGSMPASVASPSLRVVSR